LGESSYEHPDEEIKQSMENQNAPYLVVGLGNPGREYRDTRHNVGFQVIDQLCKVMGASISKVQAKALVGIGTLEGRKVILAKPQTFMNLSGQAVGGLMHFYKVPLEQIIVAHDDLDLPLGTLRLRPDGGSAGQKGIASTIQQLGTQNFARLRVGIGRPPGQMDASAYVLKKFTAAEQEMLALVLDRAAAAVRVFARDGLAIAMNQYNGNIQER
jgi:PTH1 family peptidyl-tRNA hydrolase